MSKKVKLSTEYPVVDDFKRAFKRRNSDVKVDQIKGFDRRVRGSPLLMRMVEVAQKLKDKPGEEAGEIKRAWDICRGYQITEPVLREKIKELEAENASLKEELQEAKDHLKWYG